MIACPACSSTRTLIHVDSSRHARCRDCGSSWIQEGAWQRSILRPANTAGPRAVAKIAAPNSVSSLDLALAVVGELQRTHGAEVMGHDMAGGVPEISLRLPVTSPEASSLPAPESDSSRPASA